MSMFLAQDVAIAPFEFRSLSGEDAEEIGAREQKGGQRDGRSHAERRFGSLSYDREAREAMVKGAADAARSEGFQQGEREGRRAGRAEVEAEMNAALTLERNRIAEAVTQFRRMRERYFVDVEQVVVKLALAIAARVLHREAEIDPLLLAGVVKVALGKMADRSGVILRVAGGDTAGWERAFLAAEAADRPRVIEDTSLDRGACVLETKMGTVELGVKVQLEEIEKGFFDLVNHRPVE